MFSLLGSSAHAKTLETLIAALESGDAMPPSRPGDTPLQRRACQAWQKRRDACDTLERQNADLRASISASAKKPSTACRCASIWSAAPAAKGCGTWR